MEQWEKECLEVIQSRKNEHQLHYTEGQREYINACWEEVNRPDGSKRYKPKQDKFNKSKKKVIRYYAEKVSFLKTLFRLLRRLLGFFLLFVVCALVLGTESQAGPIIALVWLIGSIALVANFIYFVVRCACEGNLRL